jgi:hypothetical protein
MTLSRRHGAQTLLPQTTSGHAFRGSAPHGHCDTSHPGGRYPMFIDDLVTVSPDIGDNASRAPGAPLLAMHLLRWPLATDEHLPHEVFLPWSKLAV